jgi:hypothetical protein
MRERSARLVGPLISPAAEDHAKGLIANYYPTAKIIRVYRDQDGEDVLVKTYVTVPTDGE